MHVLITGGAGFIGSTLGMVLLERGDRVTAIDNLNDYYDVSLKESRLKRLNQSAEFRFLKMDIADRDGMTKLFSSDAFDAVVNLAAQAGVRYSIENPAAYVDANLVGFGNILEGCRHSGVSHLVYASSSSVYGSNTKLPFSEQDSVDHPISLYAASKKANELMAHAYSHLYQMPTTGLRFFTVYGPWGRPDMALFKFTKGILEGTPIPVFNQGQMVRDFTYIDDIVEGVKKVIDQPAKRSGDQNSAHRSVTAPWKIYNIGNSHRVQLMDYIAALEKALGKKAVLELLPMQDGDVLATEADLSALEEDFGYRPQVKFEEGIHRFVDWYCRYYQEDLKN
ncbi:NAD-dependent epimerase [Arenicellales bacterium IMCC58067]